MLVISLRILNHNFSLEGIKETWKHAALSKTRINSHQEDMLIYPSSRHGYFVKVASPTSSTCTPFLPTCKGQKLNRLKQHVDIEIGSISMKNQAIQNLLSSPCRWLMDFRSWFNTREALHELMVCSSLDGRAQSMLPFSSSPQLSTQFF